LKYQQSPPQVSVYPFFYRYASPQTESFSSTCTIVGDPSTGCCLITIVRKAFDTRSRFNHALIPLLGHEGNLGDHPFWAKSNRTSELDTTSLPKTLIH
jgi:hypothetical protein